MKVKLLIVFMVILTVSTFGLAQDVVSDVGKAAKDTGRISEKVAHKTAHGTVKATRMTVRGSEKVATETARGSE